MSSHHNVVLARTNFRGRSHLVRIAHSDRRSHLYVIGKTGTGKSTLLETHQVQSLRSHGSRRTRLGSTHHLIPAHHGSKRWKGVAFLTSWGGSGCILRSTVQTLGCCSQYVPKRGVGS
jgi:hypothetical protein